MSEFTRTMTAAERRKMNKENKAIPAHASNIISSNATPIPRTHAAKVKAAPMPPDDMPAIPDPEMTVTVERSPAQEELMNFVQAGRAAQTAVDAIIDEHRVSTGARTFVSKEELLAAGSLEAIAMSNPLHAELAEGVKEEVAQEKKKRGRAKKSDTVAEVEQNVIDSTESVQIVSENVPPEGISETAVTIEGALEKASERREAKKQVSDDLRRLEQHVVLLKQMTDTDAWQALYSYLSKLEAQTKKRLEKVKGLGDLKLAQAELSVIRAIRKHVKSPVAELQEYISTMALFSAKREFDPHWNSKKGTVSLSYKNIEKDS